MDAAKFGLTRAARCDKIARSEVAMIKTIDALFDGQVFRPRQPVLLEPNTPVRITIETETSGDDEEMSFLDTARSLNLDGPADWSANLEDYLYGDKRGK